MSTINLFDSNDSKKLRIDIIAEFEDDLILKDFEDLSRLDYKDRCFKFFLNVIEDGELYSITLYLSILSPFYVIVPMKPSVVLFFHNQD